MVFIKQTVVENVPPSLELQHIGRGANRDALRTVLHVDPVVAVVPDALDAEVVARVQWMW